MPGNLTSATIDVRANTKALERDIQKALKTVELSQINTKKNSQALGRITGQVSEFNKSLEASNARVIAFGASAGAIFAVERAISSLISTTIEVEKKLADINVLLNASAETLDKFSVSLFSIARNTAQSFSTVADAAAEFARQGLGIEETLKRTNAALILTRLSGLDAVKSVEALTATINSFSNSALDATGIVNKLATVDADFAVSSADLANAISRVGSTAQDAGVSLDELISIVTAAQQTTSRGGAVIGNSLKTIFTRLQRGKVQSLLESLGVDTSEGQSAISLLQQLASVYDGLSASQKSYVAEQVGGVFQINILKAALGDLGKEFSIYNRALNTSLFATDEAIRRNEELNQTISALSTQAFANLQQAADKIGSIVFEPNAKNFLSSFNNVLESFNNIDTESQGGKFIEGFFKGISNFIGGPGTVLAVAVLTKLFFKLSQFAAGSAKELLGRNEATKQQAALEQSVLSILQKNNQFTNQILSGKMSAVQAEKQILSYLTAQSNIMKEQERLSKVIAGNLSRSGVSVGKTGIPTVKSAGFIPNFASEQAIGQAMENAGARQHGYKAGKAKKTRIHDGTGKSFQSWVNNKEDVVNFRNADGKKATIVRPPNGFGENTEIAAAGFIPNFANKQEKYTISSGTVKKKKTGKDSQASLIADADLDTYPTIVYDVIRAGTQNSFYRKFYNQVSNLGFGNTDEKSAALNYFKESGIPLYQIKTLEQNASKFSSSDIKRGKNIEARVPLLKPDKKNPEKTVPFSYQLDRLRNNVLGKSRYEKFASKKTGIPRSFSSNSRMDLYDPKNKKFAEVKLGELKKDNLLAKAIAQSALIYRGFEDFWLDGSPQRIPIKSGFKLIIPQETRDKNIAAAGFIPNFAGAKMQAGLKNILAQQGGSSIFASRGSKAAIQKAGRIPYKDLGNLDYTMIHPQDEGVMPTGEIDILRKDKRTGIQSKYFAKFKTSGLSSSDVAKQANAKNLQSDVSNFLLSKANDFASIFNPAAQFSNIGQFSDKGAVMTAVGTVFESAIRKAFNQEAQSKTQAFDFPSPNAQLRDFFGNAPGPYEAKGSNSLPNKQSSLEKWVRNNNLFGGFIPNFASGIVTGDVIRGNEYKAVLDFLAKTPKPVRTILGPSGSGKTTMASKAGGKIVKSFQDLAAFDSYILDRAVLSMPKDQTVADNLKKIFSKSGDRGALDVLVGSRNTIKSLREKRAATGDLLTPGRAQLTSGTGGISSFTKGVRGFASEYPGASVSRIFKKAGEYQTRKILSGGFLPNFAIKGLTFSQGKKDEFGFSTLVAKIDGKKVGSFEYSEDKPGKVSVDDISVAREYRGQGIAGELYRKAMEINRGKMMSGQILPQTSRFLEKLKAGQAVSAETLYPQMKRAQMAKKAIFEVWGHRGMDEEEMTTPQFKSFIEAQIKRLKNNPSAFTDFFGDVEKNVFDGLGVQLKTQSSSGFIPNFLDIKKSNLPIGVRGRTNYGNGSKSNIELGTGATENTLAHELFHNAYSRSTFRKSVSNPSIGKFISDPKKYAGVKSIISSSLFKGVNEKNLYSGLGLNPVQLDFDGKNSEATYSGPKAIDELVTRIQEKVFGSKGNLDLLSADEKTFVRNLENAGIIDRKRLSNISRRSKEGSKFRALVENRFSSAMDSSSHSGFLPNFADQVRRNLYDWDGTIIPKIQGPPDEYISKLKSIKEKDLLPIGKKLKSGKKRFDILTARPQSFEGAIYETASRLGLPFNEIKFGIKPKDKLVEASKRNAKIVDDDLSLLGEKGYLNARVINKRLGSGFVPNFADISQVMALESAMSGEKATFHTKPFPHIRNKSQPTFGSAMADHGGLNNAIKDSVRGQKSAGLLSRGFVPNFADPATTEQDNSFANSAAAVIAALQSVAFTAVFLGKEIRETNKSIKDGKQSIKDLENEIVADEGNLKKQKLERDKSVSALSSPDAYINKDVGVKQAQAAAYAAQQKRDTLQQQLDKKKNASAAAGGTPINANYEKMQQGKIAKANAAFILATQNLTNEKQKVTKSLQGSVNKINSEIAATDQSIADKKKQISSTNSSIKTSRASRFSNLGFQLGTMAQVAAPQVASFIPQESSAGRAGAAAVEGLGNIAGYAGMGAMFGPWGAAIGAAVGVTLEFNKVLKAYNTKLPEYEKAFSNASESMTKFSETGQKALQLSEQYKQIVQSSDPSAAADLVKVQQEYQKTLLELTSTQRESLSSAIAQGKGQEAYSKILKELSDSAKTKETEFQLRKIEEDGKKSDMVGLSDTLAKSFVIDTGISSEALKGVVGNIKPGGNSEKNAQNLLENLSNAIPADAAPEVRQNLESVINAFKSAASAQDLSSASDQFIKKIIDISNNFASLDEAKAQLEASMKAEQLAKQKEIQIRDEANARLLALTRQTEVIIENSNAQFRSFIETLKFASEFDSNKRSSNLEFVKEMNAPNAAKKLEEENILINSRQKEKIETFQATNEFAESFSSSLRESIKSLDLSAASQVDTDPDRDIKLGNKKLSYDADVASIQSLIRSGRTGEAKDQSTALIEKLKKENLGSQSGIDNLNQTVDSQFSQFNNNLQAILQSNQRGLGLATQQLASMRKMEQLRRAQDFGGSFEELIQGKDPFANAIESLTSLRNSGFSQKRLENGQLDPGSLNDRDRATKDGKKLTLDSKGRYNEEISRNQANDVFNTIKNLSIATGGPVVSTQDKEFQVVVDAAKEMLNQRLFDLKEANKANVNPITGKTEDTVFSQGIIKKIEADLATLNSAQNINGKNNDVAILKVMKSLGVTDSMISGVGGKEYEEGIVDSISNENLKAAYVASSDEAAKATIALGATVEQTTSDQTKSLVDALAAYSEYMGQTISGQAVPIAEAIRNALEQGKAKEEVAKKEKAVFDAGEELSSIDNKSKTLSEKRSAISKKKESEDYEVAKNLRFIERTGEVNNNKLVGLEGLTKKEEKEVDVASGRKMVKKKKIVESDLTMDDIKKAISGDESLRSQIFSEENVKKAKAVASNSRASSAARKNAEAFLAGAEQQSSSNKSKTESEKISTEIKSLELEKTNASSRVESAKKELETAQKGVKPAEAVASNSVALPKVSEFYQGSTKNTASPSSSAATAEGVKKGVESAMRPALENVAPAVSPASVPSSTAATETKQAEKKDERVTVKTPYGTVKMPKSQAALAQDSALKAASERESSAREELRLIEANKPKPTGRHPKTGAPMAKNSAEMAAYNSWSSQKQNALFSIRNAEEAVSKRRNAISSDPQNSAFVNSAGRGSSASSEAITKFNTPGGATVTRYPKDLGNEIKNLQKAFSDAGKFVQGEGFKTEKDKKNYHEQKEKIIEKYYNGAGPNPISNQSSANKVSEAESKRLEQATNGQDQLVPTVSNIESALTNIIGVLNEKLGTGAPSAVSQSPTGQPTSSAGVSVSTPFNLTVNTSSGEQENAQNVAQLVAGIVTQKIQEAVPEIIKQVKIQMGEKPPPTTTKR